MTAIYNLLFVGVGGQGSLLISELTSIAAVQAGYDVKQTEVHGVSQRGGSVETHVRFGDKVYSPIVTPGEAQVVLSLEKLEALRYAHYTNPDQGTLLINDFEIIPGSVSNAADLYPHQAFDHLRSLGFKIVTLPASEVARSLGDARMANVVLLGGLSTFLPIEQSHWQKSLQVRLPRPYLEGNIQAFAAGRDMVMMEKRDAY